MSVQMALDEKCSGGGGILAFRQPAVTCEGMRSGIEAHKTQG